MVLETLQATSLPLTAPIRVIRVIRGSCPDFTNLASRSAFCYNALREDCTNLRSFCVCTGRTAKTSEVEKRIPYVPGTLMVYPGVRHEKMADNVKPVKPFPLLAKTGFFLWLAGCMGLFLLTDPIDPVALLFTLFPEASNLQASIVLVQEFLLQLLSAPLYYGS
jgi:hypothetical protein